MGRFARKWNCVAAILTAAAITCAQPPQPTVTNVTLEAPSGKPVTYASFQNKVTVFIFVSTRCPISNAFNFRVNSLYKDFGNKVRFIVLDSNVNESAREVQEHAKNMEYEFPVFRDIDNKVADLLGAKATPDSFVIDRSGAISYHGYIEDAVNPQRSKDPALRLAIEAALENRPAPVRETHARGCAIRRKLPIS